jgi:predicted ATPase
METGRNPAPANRVRSIEISGLRGFAEPQRLDLALPNGKPGSGITIILGPNNAGKSTIIEAFRAMANSSPPSLTEGQRNRETGERVTIRIENTAGESKELRTVEPRGAQTILEAPSGVYPNWDNLYVLPARRAFNPSFHKAGYTSRLDYLRDSNVPPQFRGAPMDRFSQRMFMALDKRTDFNNVLKRVVDQVPDWTIDSWDTGNYYLKFYRGDAHHSSDGLGEGFISLMFIVDSLYDSSSENIVVIDEPELSLHPALQKKLFAMLADYARDRQIIYATHSPYFVDFETVVKGAEIARVWLEGYHSRISTLSRGTVDKLAPFLRNANNPHILGLDAREVLFLHDGVILLEGSDDVVWYPEICRQVSIELRGQFYGWGAGGASNMPVILAMLADLGFKRVAGILDSNEASRAPLLGKEFPQYKFFVIPAEDVRSKRKRAAVRATRGLLDEDRRLRAEYRNDVAELLGAVNTYLARTEDASA